MVDTTKTIFISMVDVILSGSVRAVAIPIIVITLIIFFLRWVVASSKGERMEDLSNEYSTVQQSFSALRNGRTAYTEYRRDHPLRERRGRRW